MRQTKHTSSILFSGAFSRTKGLLLYSFFLLVLGWSAGGCDTLSPPTELAEPTVEIALTESFQPSDASESPSEAPPHESEMDASPQETNQETNLSEPTHPPKEGDPEHARPDTLVELPPEISPEPPSESTPEISPEAPPRRPLALHFKKPVSWATPSIHFSFGMEWKVDEALDALLTEDLIDPAIVVGIYNTGPTRSIEYVGTLAADKKAQYSKWIVEHLKPYIDHHYRTLHQSAYTTVMGSSFGGIISIYLSWNYPQIFGAAGCVSNSFRENGAQFLADLLAYQGPKKPVRYWIDAGYEEGEKYPDGRAWYLANNRIAFVVGYDIRVMRERRRVRRRPILGPPP
ncbi:esterase family protein [Myxococcota bacterium]|nr:esterase family protein [Myxococcota bacterium]